MPVTGGRDVIVTTAGDTAIVAAVAVGCEGRSVEVGMKVVVDSGGSVTGTVAGISVGRGVFVGCVAGGCAQAERVRNISKRICLFFMLLSPFDLLEHKGKLHQAQGFGAALGVMSLVRREGRMLLAITGVALNTLSALFHLLIVVFAG